VLNADVIADESCRARAGVGDQGLVLVEFQPEGLPEEPRQPGLDLLSFGLRPGKFQDVVVCLCRLRDYADCDVNVLVRMLMAVTDAGTLAGI
jgi:hypothetical protein